MLTSFRSGSPAAVSVGKDSTSGTLHSAHSVNPTRYSDRQTGQNIGISFRHLKFPASVCFDSLKRRLAQFIGRVPAPIGFVRQLSLANDEFHGIAHANGAAANHPAVQREPAVEAFLDLLKHFGRLFLSIRIP